MKIDYRPYDLKLKFPFAISGFSREATPLMLVELNYEGLTGLGEASMVPYMGESHETAGNFLEKADLSWIRYPFNYDEVITYLDGLAPGNPNIKAAIDIALHDLQGKIEKKPCYTYFGSDPAKMPVTSYTLGIDTPEMILKKVKDGEHCKVLKIKLGGGNDKELIETVRSVSDKPLYADANQGWKNREEALDMLFWLEEKGVMLVEQPMLKTDPDSNAWLTERSPIPIIGDESVQRLPDVDKAKGVYTGVNLKLMKSAGMHEGYKIIQKAREYGMKILIGCMSETSVATLAGVALAPLCDWADLDGPLLITNNPYLDPGLIDGKYVLTEDPGLGVKPPTPKGG